MQSQLSHEQWVQFEQDGYLRLGKVLTDHKLHALQQRIDDIMLGTAPVDYDKIMMQLDRIPGETDGPGPQTKGHKGATLRYRKMQDLEMDPLFLDYLCHPLFQNICARTYGTDKSIACFRAMFMNKPAGEGTRLVWHQDRWSYLDRDPLITIWTALDPATIDNGCVYILPQTHHTLINPDHVSGFFNDEQEKAARDKGKAVPLEMDAGEAVLLHNHLPHSSGVNTTEGPRRAFSVCYMDAATVDQHGNVYTVVM